MDRQNNISPFFRLPLELREQIYAEVLSSPAQGPELLRACREIHIEGCKFLYQRPLDFTSQLHLYDWVNTTPDEFLTHVTDISLSVQDVDVRTLLEPGAATNRAPIPAQLHTWDLYEAEYHKLKESLKKLAGVKAITIRALIGRQSHLYRDLLTKILDSLYHIYPTLHGLSLEGNLRHQNLIFLGNFNNLRSFSFGGLSSSSSTETGEVLSSLSHLNSLAVISRQPMIIPNSYPKIESGTRSYINDTMRMADQLASFSVAESTPLPAADIFTLEFLAAMHSRKSLKSMSISVSHIPEDSTLDRLEQYLKTSAIECLKLDWPGLNAEVLEAHALVRDNIKTLWIRAKSMEDASKILLSLLKRRRAGMLRELRKLVLIRTTALYRGKNNTACGRKDSAVITAESGGVDKNSSSDDSDEDNLVKMKRQLEVLGMAVAWYTEDM